MAKMGNVFSNGHLQGNGERFGAVPNSVGGAPEVNLVLNVFFHDGYETVLEDVPPEKRATVPSISIRYIDFSRVRFKYAMDEGDMTFSGNRWARQAMQRWALRYRYATFILLEGSVEDFDYLFFPHIAEDYFRPLLVADYVTPESEIDEYAIARAA